MASDAGESHAVGVNVGVILIQKKLNNVTVFVLVTLTDKRHQSSQSQHSLRGQRSGVSVYTVCV